MVCIISKIGLNIVSNRVLLEAAIPRGIPISIQKITAVKIIANVVIASCHRSTKSIDINAREENIANLIPFVLKAKYANIKITIGKGI